MPEAESIARYMEIVADLFHLAGMFSQDKLIYPINTSAVYFIGLRPLNGAHCDFVCHVYNASN